jgi:hypothetical protein
MAMEYGGVVECWVGQFSIHAYKPWIDGAILWVGDQSDYGGLRQTAQAVGHGTDINAGPWCEISSENFDNTSHGPLRFRLVNDTDAVEIWQGGRYTPSAYKKHLALGTVGPTRQPGVAFGPTGAGVLFFDAGALKYSGPGGLVGTAASGIGLQGSGSLAPLLLVPRTVAGAPTTGTHSVGEIVVDSKGALFQCVAPGTPGTWMRIGYNALPQVRICDTSAGSGPPKNPSNAYAGVTVGPQGSGSDTLTVTVAGAYPSPASTPNPGVPLQAQSANLVIGVVPGAAGGLSVYPADQATPPVATAVTWSLNKAASNTVNAALGAAGGPAPGKIKLLNRSASPIQLTIDLGGFYS